MKSLPAGLNVLSISVQISSSTDVSDFLLPSITHGVWLRVRLYLLYLPEIIYIILHTASAKYIKHMQSEIVWKSALISVRIPVSSPNLYGIWSYNSVFFWEKK